MTLKHVKFEDSVTMRSLEKVAREKGWVQSEPIEKTAKKKDDYSVTSNLTENVIKLCTGLRNSGFTKYADELESKFMAYKKATNMYDTTGEKGEDLVDAAHPHGSHKLEGVDGDSVIETILDQQLKDVEMVNKHPSGKLSSAKDVLNAVKIVLADAADDLKKNLNNVMNSVQQINDLYYDVSFFNRPTADPKKALSMAKLLLTEPSKANALSLKAHLNYLNKTYAPPLGEYLGALLGGMTQDVYDEMSPFFDFANKSLDAIIGSISKEEEAKNAPAVPAPAAVVAPEVQSLMNTFSDVQKKVARYKAIVEAKELPNSKALVDYLDRVNAAVSARMSSFNKQPDANKSELSKIYLDKLNSEIIPGLSAFEGAYVNA